MSVWAELTATAVPSHRESMGRAEVRALVLSGDGASLVCPQVPISQHQGQVVLGEGRHSMARDRNQKFSDGSNAFTPTTKKSQSLNSRLSTAHHRH